MRVTISVTRPATLNGQRRIVSKCASRQKDAISQLLGGYQQQYPSVRGRSATTEGHMHGLAGHRWNAGQNPRPWRAATPWLRVEAA
jgi:hypothetical protein